jgi:uncharacterized metal-binding protein YceD (DUF177 family)
MKLNVLNLHKELGKTESHHIEMPLSTINEERFKLLGPVEVFIKLIMTADSVAATGTIKFKAELTCDRCNRPYEEVFAQEFAEEYLNKTNIQKRVVEEASSKEKFKEDFEDYLFVISERFEIELEPLVRQTVYLSLPYFFHCGRPDCRVEYETPQSKDTVKDSRWDELKKLKN